jgi:hypothetical protein
MFEHLKTYSRIIVSGPQRSGTRIASRMIASDCDYKYIDEKEFKVSNTHLLDALMQSENIVVQAPGVCHLLHTLSYHSLLICLMIRPTNDIEASEQRINWDNSCRKLELSHYGKTEGSPSKAKYDFWHSAQKPQLEPHCLEINYKSLKDHPLYIKKQDRKNFKWNQTEL